MKPRFTETAEPQRTCPACESAGLTVFYAVDQIPTQSNLLLRTHEEAVSHPAGNLRLAHCPACGFITSTEFDPATQRLDPRYEATQGFSPTFGGFARSLAARWTEQYKLAGKTILEIGCGQGDFLEMFCEQARCDGIGIDPVLSRDRVRSAPANLQLIADVYSGKYADLPVDFICCRHTLEHLPNPLAFLRMIRKCIGDRDIPVCFEVPDTLRVLNEGAFWDLYYEHCSYFSQASLARCFAAAGFDVQAVRLEFSGQYLVIESRPGAGKYRNEVSPNNRTIREFQSTAATAIEHWTQLLSDGKRTALWGSGSKAVGFLTTLGIQSEQLPCVVDINPRKQGTYLPTTGQQIIAPDQLKGFAPQRIIVMNPAYRDEIARSLAEMQIGAEVIAL
jgi:SAM-dependent methyltransferase